VPANWLEWVAGEVKPTVAIRHDHNFIALKLAKGSGLLEERVPPDRFDASVLETWLGQCGLRRDQVMIGIELPGDCFFVRDIRVPKTALEALPRILEQEIARRTPFQLADIWHDGVAVPDAKLDVQTVQHWIARKDLAETRFRELGLEAKDIDFIAAKDSSGQVIPVIRLRAPVLKDPPWVRQLTRYLIAASIGVVLIGLAALEWTETLVANGLEASLAEASELARGAGAADPAARLFAMRADVGVLDVWDELSRILPDHTFVSETRIVDGHVKMSGFSADAARLVRLIDQSPLFFGAKLTSDIRTDTTEQKDHFAISFNLRTTQALGALKTRRAGS